MAIGDEVVDPPLELPAGSAWKEQTAFLQHRPHLVFEVAPDPYQSGSTHEDGSRGLAFFTLDGNLPIPADPDEFRQTASIILVALVHANGQGRMGVTRIDADHGQTGALEFMPEPTRHGARLEADAFGIGSFL